MKLIYPQEKFEKLLEKKKRSTNLDERKSWEDFVFETICGK